MNFFFTNNFKKFLYMDKELSYYLDSKNFKPTKPPNTEEDHITSYTYLNKKEKSMTLKWSKKDTKKFYKLLELCGTDFSMISEAFEFKTRKQIKNKLKKEEIKDKEFIKKILNSKKEFNKEEYDIICNNIK